MKKAIYLRNATIEDAEILLEWRNDSSTRKNSFNSDLIDYGTHIKWLHTVLKKNNVIFFILQNKEVPIGQIRLNVDDGIAEISYSIGEKFRKQGYGKKILKLMEENIIGDFTNIKVLKALVRKENIASCHLFRILNYQETERYNHFEYIKNIK